MNWKTLLVLTNLSFIAFVKTDNLIEAIKSILFQDGRPTSLLTPNICWNQHQVTSFAKQLANLGTNVASSLQKNRPEYYLQHLVVMVDLNCSGAEDLMKKGSENGYFKSPYRWLLLDIDGTHSDILNDIEMLVDSDVLLMRKSDYGEYHFLEAYKIDKHSEIIYNTRATWRPFKVNSTDYYLRGTNTNTKGFLQDCRESTVLSSRRHNLRRHTLTMINVITDSNETRKHMTDRLQLHQDSITKMSFTVVQICFEMLNATENLLFTHTWGYKDNNWQGIVDHLIKKKADIGTLTLFTQERLEVIDYIAMVGSTAVRFVFREPPLSYMSNIFVLPFSGAVWIAVVVCILGCSVFLYITSRWESNVDTGSMNQFHLHGSWADVLILVIGAVLQQGCTLEPRYAPGRTVTLLLFLALTVLFSAYSANIVVLLRAPSSSVRTLKDLLHSPLKFGASDFSYNRYFFKKLNDPIRKEIYVKKIAPKGKEPNFYSMEEGVEKIRRGLFAFHMESNPGYRLIQEKYREDEKCDLVEIDYINEIDPWIPGQKRSPFKDLFKINFIKIREVGLQSCIHRRLNVPRPRCSGSVSTFSSVGITDMYPAMLATAYITLLAPAVLLLEIAHHRLMQRRQERRNKNQPTNTPVIFHR